MSRVTLIQHINIQISNRERTREWYETVLGAEFLDRGPESNKRQLQLRIGNGEIHTTDNPNPVIASSVHFAVEINDWDETIGKPGTVERLLHHPPGGFPGAELLGPAGLQRGALHLRPRSRWQHD